MHEHFDRDEYAPDHKLHRGQRFWRDGTPDEAASIMERRIASMQKKYPCSKEDAARLIEDARRGASSDGPNEFRAGWPMSDVEGARG